LNPAFGPARPVWPLTGDIIIKSSNVNITHQIIIITTQAIDSHNVFWSFQEDQQPSGRAGAVLRLLQLLPIHKSLRVTPAMAAGITDELIS
jgi:hypothetical protein